jgi:hypothetical protein
MNEAGRRPRFKITSSNYKHTMNTIQKFGTVPVAALLLLAAGGIGSAATSAFAQSASTSTGTAASQQMPGQFDQHRGGHIGRNGVAEVLLTGDAAAKLTAAAQAAQPGATIERVETDAEGAAYEAHLTKADGSHITLKFDTNYAVTATEDDSQGPGRGAPQGSLPTQN